MSWLFWVESRSSAHWKVYRTERKKQSLRRIIHKQGVGVSLPVLHELQLQKNRVSDFPSAMKLSVDLPVRAIVSLDEEADALDGYVPIGLEELAEA